MIGSLLLAACGGSVSDNGGIATDDTGTPSADTGVAPTDDAAPADDTGAPTDDTAPADAGGPSTTYPAFVDSPILQNNHGAVLNAPVIVTVTWPGDANADKYEEFGDKIGATDYWKQITAEYGVAPAVSGASNHARMTDPLGASITVSPGGTDDLSTWVSTHVADAAKYGLPAPTGQTIYVLYIDPKTKFNYGGTDICSSGVGGYHSSVDVAGAPVAFAVLPQCDHGGGVLDETTLSSSHEIAEATLDPNPMDPGYVGVDDNHFAWSSFMQGNVENGDLCEIYQDSYYRPAETDFTYMVQRQWSNASSKAGHNPCVPAPKTAYYNTVTLSPDRINVTTRGGAIRTTGFAVAVGDSKTFQVGFASDAALPAWNIKTIEGNAFVPTGTARPHNLDVTIDKTSGVNGEIANVTVKVLTAGKRGYNVITVVSTKGSGATAVQHYNPIVIANP